MESAKIQITEKDKIKKILNGNKYLTVFIGLIFLTIDYDLFSSQPIVLKAEGFFWKGIAIAFQLIFIGTLIKWEIKKRKTINILNNGMITRGELKFSQRIKPNDSSSFYVHLFEYSVANKKYEVAFKNKKNSVNSSYIIYQIDKPENGMLYQELKEGLKKLILNKKNN